MSYDPTQPAVIGEDSASEQPATSESGSTGAPQQDPKDVAQGKAHDVASNAKQSGGQLASTAKEEAGDVAAEAKAQARDLAAQAQEEFASQASRQHERATSALHDIASELGSMADNADTPGAATDVVRQAADRVSSAAGWLESRQTGELLDDVKDFARQRPGAFLAAAAAVGFVAGRLTRGLTDDAPNAGADDAPNGDPDPYDASLDPTLVDPQQPTPTTDAWVDVAPRDIAR